jgi:hypothetical protein
MFRYASHAGTTRLPDTSHWPPISDHRLASGLLAGYASHHHDPGWKNQMSIKCAILVTFILALTTGCTYYQTAPGVYATTPVSKFDRSWSAAVGALVDQDVNVTTENRTAGVVQGTRNGIDVVANVLTQADGSVRVEFNTSGNTARDPGLIDRVTASYNRRMGR